MQIDTLTVVAQIFNFALLVWLLNRFLYKPVVNVIAAREDAVNQRIAQAEALKAEAQQQLLAYQRQRAELDAARERLLQEAREEARRLREQLLAQVAAEADAERQRLLEQLEAEKRELTEAVQEGLIRQAGAVAKRLLRDMAGADLGDGVIAALAARLEDNSELLAKAPLPVTVRVSFVPSDQQAARLRSILSGLMNRELGDEDVVVLHDEALLLGAEVQLDGTLLAWHAREFVAAWEEDAAALAAGRGGGEGDGADA